MSWLTTARRLLRNWTCSQSATPLENELSDLAITLQQCESDQLLGLHNIGVIRDFISDPKRRIQQQLRLMPVVCPPGAPIYYHSRYASSLLADFICDLSEHATKYIHEERGRIRVHHDTSSPGTHLDINIPIPDTTGSTFQYIAVVGRQRNRPESFPTVVELYSLLSLAARFRNQKTHTGLIKVRLFVVYSCWVQALSATAPLSYIISILEQRDHIEGNMEISESPWFNLLSLPDFERILLYAFESATLADHKRIPEMFTKLRETPQSLRPKRKMDILEGGVAKTQKVRRS